MFPTIVGWVGGEGYIVIGNQDGFGSVVRTVESGGIEFKAETPDTPAGTMAELERGPTTYFDEEGS